MFMRRELAMNRLRDMDTGFGVHVYRKPDLALVLGETGQRLDRHLVEPGSGERAGPRRARRVRVRLVGASRGGDAAYRRTPAAPPTAGVGDLESALSRWGVISQIPVDRVTFMTTAVRAWP